jgi:hypothetical protein
LFHALSLADSRYPQTTFDIQPDGPGLLAEPRRYPAHEELVAPWRRSIPDHAPPEALPLHKTQFVRDAHAFTVAPDDWKILLSQRRRWINSTVHNLGELMFLEQLCGFCCFSMRFVVMIDLVSTIIQPITVGYVRPVHLGFSSGSDLKL